MTKRKKDKTKSGNTYLLYSLGQRDIRRGKCHELDCDYSLTKAVGQLRPTRTRRGSRSRDKAIYIRTLHMFRHVNIYNIYIVITATI